MINTTTKTGRNETGPILKRLTDSWTVKQKLENSRVLVFCKNCNDSDIVPWEKPNDTKYILWSVCVQQPRPDSQGRNSLNRLN